MLFNFPFLLALLLLFFITLGIFIGLGFLLSLLLPFSLFEASLLSLITGLLFSVFIMGSQLNENLQQLLDVLIELSDEELDEEDGEYKA